MDRREFFRKCGMTFMAATTARLLAGCGGGGGGASVPANSFSVTSAVAQGHAHTIDVIRTDLSTPPAAGVVYVSSPPTTAYIENHTHSITLTSQQLTTIN